MEQKHRDNLEKLGRYLAKLTPTHNKEHFRMQFFAKHVSEYEEEEVHPNNLSRIHRIYNECFCGTSACAIGHTPLAMPKEFKEAVQLLREGDMYVSWWVLSIPLFGFDRNDRKWEWLFSGDWDDIAYRAEDMYFRTSWAAADRIAYLLNDGEEDIVGSYYAWDKMAGIMGKCKGLAHTIGWITKSEWRTRLNSVEKIYA